MPARPQGSNGVIMPRGCDREDLLPKRKTATGCQFLEAAVGRPGAMDDSIRPNQNHLAAMILKVKVIPKSAKTEIVGKMSDGTVKIRVAAVPERGKANAELIGFLAKHYGVSREKISILTGE